MTRKEAAKAIGDIWPSCYGFKHDLNFSAEERLNRLATPENNGFGYLQLTPAMLLEVLSGLGLLKFEEPKTPITKLHEEMAKHGIFWQGAGAILDAAGLKIVEK